MNQEAPLQKTELEKEYYKIKHSNSAISPMQEYLSFEGDKMKIVCKIFILTLDNEETYHKKQKEEDEKSSQE